MAGPSNIEILPPLHADGRANNGGARDGAGRPPNVSNGFTRTVRDGIKQALENMGGAETYFTYLAATRPDLFTALVGRAMPIKVVGDDDAVYTVQRIERTIIVKK